MCNQVTEHPCYAKLPCAVRRLQALRRHRALPEASPPNLPCLPCALGASTVSVQRCAFAAFWRSIHACSQRGSNA